MVKTGLEVPRLGPCRVISRSREVPEGFEVVRLGPCRVIWRSSRVRDRSSRPRTLFFLGFYKVLVVQTGRYGSFDAKHFFLIGISLFN